MKEQTLLLASYLSRQLTTLQKRLAREGCRAAIAAPGSENAQYAQGPLLRLHKIFGRLTGVGKIRGFSHIIAFDQVAENFAKRAHVPYFRFTGDIGIDLSVWNPSAVSGNRQIQLLSEYNIAPHQRMILAFGVDERNIKALMTAVEDLGDDFIIALYGEFKRGRARRINRRIEENHKIVYLGATADLPSLLRASYAAISLSEADSFFKTAAAAMGRTTSWRGAGPKPSVPMNTVGGALAKLLDMGVAQKEEMEEENVRRAQARSMEKSAAKIQEILGK
ncbi:MAG: hypothetical protein LBB08_01075 [Rickettsiales bacterium]|jgi:hypothetical protein|nr:hypothetical protein [Rickettsiales bacterium]